MKIIYKYFKVLGIITTIFLPILMLASCKKISICEGVETQNAQKISVQLKESIYSDVFGNKSCSPQQLELRLPVNYPLENQNKQLNEQQYTPKITTFVTFSNEEEYFSITRLDQKSDEWFYTQSDSCLAWKWSRNDREQNLILSMDRNLQIRDIDIKSVIFIVSLPREIKEAGKVKVNITRYTWNKATSRLGGIENFKRQYYPEIVGILRETERRNSSNVNTLSPGKAVNDDIKTELKEIDSKGGVFLVSELESMKDSEKKESYVYSPESPACEIPNDFK